MKERSFKIIDSIRVRGVLMLSALVLISGAEAFAGYREGYYKAMDGKKREALKEAAKSCVAAHTQLEYSNLPEYWQYSDVYPDLVNGCRRWWDMYSNTVYLIQAGQTGKQSFSANKMQREHSIPKSWWKKLGSVEYTPAYSDMWNLYPSDGAANQAKLNYPPGLVEKATFDNGVTRVGTARTGTGGGSANVFEPGEEYRGDFARAFFYMATVYDDINWVVTYMIEPNSYPTLRSWAVDMLLDWARRDPVSQKEIDRNNLVEQYQGNRNPFVDFPELAEYIWGTRTSETFHISDQPGSDPTPPVSGDPEIVSPVSGETLDYGQTAVGNVVNRVLEISGHNLTEALSLRVTGADAALFKPEVTSIPAATMNQNRGYLLNISYAPQSIGKHEAKIVLYDGGLSGSIAVTLRGEALARPELKALHANEPQDMDATSYTASWSEAEGIADYYILTRIRYRDGSTESERYETGETSYRFTDREEGVAETYSVTYSRLGIESPKSNEIYVAATGGIDAVEESGAIELIDMPDGVLIRIAGGAIRGLRIHDVQGRELPTPSEIVSDTFIPLSPGCYILTAPGLRPRRILR